MPRAPRRRGPRLAGPGGGARARVGARPGGADAGGSGAGRLRRHHRPRRSRRPGPGSRRSPTRWRRMIYPADPLGAEGREAAQKALAAGLIVAIPTDTVYVLAVDPFVP